MTLQRQLRLAAWLAAVAVLLVMATLLVTARQVSQAMAQSTYAGELTSGGIAALRTLTIEYVLNPGQVTRLKWWQRHESLAALLAQEPFNAAAEQELLESIRMRHRHVQGLFPRLAESLETHAADAGKQKVIGQGDSSLVLQILSATEDMVTEARRLLDLNLAEVDRASRRAVVIIAVATAGLGLLIAVGLVMAMRGIVRPIRALQQEAELMVLGRLERPTRIALNNEIGDLSRAFDDMAARLAATHAALQARSVDSEAANKELESFSYSVSHDLRAPLRGIDGWSLALAEDLGDKLDDRTRSHVDFIRTEAQRMGRLIDDLLKLSRVSRHELVRNRVDLSKLAGVIAARLIQALPARSIEIVVQPGLIAIADSRLMEIVLTNLLENACKFTSTLAQAHIEVKRGDATEVGAPPGQALFCVSDNGVGFDMAHAGKLFGAFQRLHRASEFPGTGIGLATVQRILHRHGGHIWADAAPGQGARFHFSLPKAT